MTPVALPGGTLWSADDGPVTVRMPRNRTDRRQVAAWLDGLAAVRVPDVLLPRRVTDRGAEVELEYPDESRKTIPLVAVAADWTADPRSAVPQVMGLGQFALATATRLSAPGVPAVAFGPAVVRHLPGGAWRLIAVPVPAALADWPRADPGAWLWAAPRSLLVGGPPDPVRAVGSALHAGLTGGLFPDLLSARERFARALVGRVGTPTRLAAAVRSALPNGAGPTADELTRFVLDCLHPDDRRRPTADEAAARFAELARRLTADELTRQWEAEGRRDVTTKLADRHRPPPPEPDELPTGKTWGDVARGHCDRGEFPQALEAARRAIRADGPVHVRHFLGVVQTWAGRSASAAEVADALDRFAKEFGRLSGEADRMRIAHLRARYLGATDLPDLAGPFESRWTEGTAILLRAWLQVRRRDGFALVSKLCKEGRKRFAAAPDKGGRVGAYAAAYLNLIDGIAHIEYAGGSGRLDYYADALTCFADGLSTASQAGATDLVEAGVEWLGLLARLARLAPDPACRNVYLGAMGVLGAYVDPAKAVAGGDVPGIPVYDEAVLFPPF